MRFYPLVLDPWVPRSPLSSPPWGLIVSLGGGHSFTRTALSTPVIYSDHIRPMILLMTMLMIHAGDLCWRVLLLMMYGVGSKGIENH